VHGLRQTYHRLRNYFGHTQWKLLGDDAQVEARFGPFGERANLDKVHGLHQTYHRLRNRFGCFSMEQLGDMGHAEYRFSLFGDNVSVGTR
jgi:hypothetical protein